MLMQDPITFKKPQWINKKVNLHSCRKLKKLLRDLNLHTVCEESFCPNISECFSSKIATFMILGDICTRDCRFCAIKKGTPKEVDYQEPARIKKAVELLGLDYVVITSPSRDDLKDGGASLYYQTVKEIKSLSKPKIKVEILIPDFLGKTESLVKVANSSADVIAHNLETVPSLYIEVRKSANYQRSLEIIKNIKQFNKNIYTKSGLMLGLGEKESEVVKVLGDLREAECDFLTLGQYLPPTLKHYRLKEYALPEKFDYFLKYALNLGFKGVKSSVYTRSSYLAHSFF